MSLRDAIHRYALAAAALAAVATLALAVALGRGLIGGRGGDQPPWITMSYYFDQNTRALFEAPADSPATLETASGPYGGMPAGVRAHVFACDDAGAAEQFIGWLEAPPEAVPEEAIDRASAVRDGEAEAPVLIRRPSDSKWVYAGSPQGRAILNQAQARCGPGRSPMYCRPPSRPR